MTGPSPKLSNTTHSTSFELLAETHLLSALLQEMWFGRSELIDVLHSRVDAFGYDLVLTTRSVTRHIQLKTRRAGARTSRINLNVELETLPSACVILMDWVAPNGDSPFSVDYLWFGGAPGLPIPPLGHQIARHAKGNSVGTKLPRPNIRNVAVGTNFERVTSIAELAVRLFGEPT